MPVAECELHAHEALALKAIESGELEIDSEGRIWRVAVRRWDRWQSRLRLRQCARRRAEHRAGKFLQIRLIEDGQRHHIQAHRLVFLHRKGQIPTGVNVVHANGHKSDNRPSNLELEGV